MLGGGTCVKALTQYLARIRTAVAAGARCYLGGLGPLAPQGMGFWFWSPWQEQR